MSRFQGNFLLRQPESLARGRLAQFLEFPGRPLPPRMRERAGANSG
jgi:hypothetical protein